MDDDSNGAPRDDSNADADRPRVFCADSERHRGRGPRRARVERVDGLRARPGSRPGLRAGRRAPHRGLPRRPVRHWAQVRRTTECRPGPPAPGRLAPDDESVAASPHRRTEPRRRLHLQLEPEPRRRLRVAVLARACGLRAERALDAQDQARRLGGLPGRKCRSKMQRKRRVLGLHDPRGRGPAERARARARLRIRRRRVCTPGHNPLRGRGRAGTRGRPDGGHAVAEPGRSLLHDAPRDRQCVRDRVRRRGDKAGLRGRLRRRGFAEGDRTDFGARRGTCGHAALEIRVSHAPREGDPAPVEEQTAGARRPLPHLWTHVRAPTARHVS